VLLLDEAAHVLDLVLELDLPVDQARLVLSLLNLMLRHRDALNYRNGLILVALGCRLMVVLVAPVVDLLLELP
jgi:hypothetical protein